MSTSKQVIALRALLMDEICQKLKQMNLTQQQGAELLGLTQPRISNLLHKKVNLFTVDGLVGILEKLSMEVQLSVSKKLSITE